MSNEELIDALQKEVENIRKNAEYWHGRYVDVCKEIGSLLAEIECKDEEIERLKTWLQRSAEETLSTKEDSNE